MVIYLAALSIGGDPMSGRGLWDGLPQSLERPPLPQPAKPRLPAPPVPPSPPLLPGPQLHQRPSLAFR